MLARILVVDDEDMNRDMLSRRLAKRDYEVLTAASAYDALAILDEQQIDLIILDVMMPGMSGMEMLTVVRQKYSSSQLPVIMATAKADSENVVDALGRGANDHVTKPLDMPVVMARIERVLAAHKTTSALEKLNKDLLNQNRLPVEKTMHLSNTPTSEITIQTSGKEQPQGSKLPPIGNKIGKYKIRKTLGVGGSGLVYLAYDPLIEREVAIKVLSPGFSQNKVRTQRFLMEARSAGRLDHPNIISVYDVNMHQGRLYIVMEYAAGGNLYSRTTELGPPPLAEACRYVIEAAQGLQIAHESNLVHRDVKPENLLLSSTEQVKVTDFGIVKCQDGETQELQLTSEGSQLGTPMYMSPEQGRMQQVDARTDVYSLGGTFYFLMTGTSPFLGESVNDLIAAHLKDPRPNPRQLNPGLSHSCTEIIAKAMAIDPAERYQTMLEFIDAVQTLRDSLTAE
jgi:DNA-binding response OmpR family regulator